jgi:uncharacterized protein
MEESTPLLIANCDGCGACCSNMSAPQYGWYFAVPPDQIPRWRQETADFKYIQGMPDEVRKKLAEFYAGDPKKDMLATPCLWLDPDTKCCGHYEWRPTICRRFQMGSVSCHGHRERAIIELPIIMERRGEEHPEQQ